LEINKKQMETIIIQDNTVVNYIPITPKKPQVAYIPREDSLQMTAVDWQYNGSNSQYTFTVDQATEITNRTGSSTPDIPVPSKIGEQVYVGVVNHSIPHIIDELFTDFLLMDVHTGDFTSLISADIETLSTPLFPISDTDPKVVSVFNGLQVLRIPIDRLNDISTVPTIFNYGKYYIKVSPKYIDSEITFVGLREQKVWADAVLNTNYNSRIVYGTNNSDFLSTPWDFTNTLHTNQNGRLQESIVEIWNNSKTIKKQTKVIVENNLGFGIVGPSSSTSFVLSPDSVGYDTPNQTIGLTDFLRIYPRETYFTPFYIEIDYKNKDLDLETLIKYTKNDAARNLKTGVLEIYDDNGITIDSGGNVNGTVIQAYQISTAANGDVEVRRKITI